MSIFEALDLLDTMVDESDPDLDLGQLDHLFQTAEAIRRDGKPDWMQLVGLIHDLVSTPSLSQCLTYAYRRLKVLLSSF